MDVACVRRSLCPATSRSRRAAFPPTCCGWVRSRLEAAFTLGKHVISVLVSGSAMPAPDALSPGILRLLGDAQTLAQSEALQERLQLGCERLLLWVSPR